MWFGWRVRRGSAGPQPKMPGFEAAYIAKELGRPVRVQWMRQEETAWDTKGPAFTFKLRGGLDAQGQPGRLRFRFPSRRLQSRGYNEAETVLISQLMGIRKPIAKQRRRAQPLPTCTASRTGAWLLKW